MMSPTQRWPPRRDPYPNAPFSGNAQCVIKPPVDRIRIDWLTWNLRSCGAQEVSPDAFLLLGPDRAAARALQGMNFQVSQIPSRSKSELPHGQLRSARLGPKADGPLRKEAQRPQRTLRRCSPEEVSGLLEAPHRIGHPPNIHTDSHFGFSVKGYQSEEIPHDHGEAGRSAQ